MKNNFILEKILLTLLFIVLLYNTYILTNRESLNIKIEKAKPLHTEKTDSIIQHYQNRIDSVGKELREVNKEYKNLKKFPESMESIHIIKDTGKLIQSLNNTIKVYYEKHSNNN